MIGVDNVEMFLQQVVLVKVIVMFFKMYVGSLWVCYVYL